MQSFENIADGWHVRALRCEGVKIRQSEFEEIEEDKDLWILFYSILGNDQWVTYALHDTLQGEPEFSLKNSDHEELKRLSIVCGDRWALIETAPISFAGKQRTQVGESRQVLDEIMAKSFEELIENRKTLEFERYKKQWMRLTRDQMILSLN